MVNVVFFEWFFLKGNWFQWKAMSFMQKGWHALSKGVPGTENDWVERRFLPILWCLNVQGVGTENSGKIFHIRLHCFALRMYRRKDGYEEG